MERLLDRGNDYFLVVSDKDFDVERRIPVSHLADNPLTDIELRLVENRLADHVEFREFYKSYGSVKLFSVDDVFESRIVIERPIQWDVLKAEVEDWVRAVADRNEVPSWVSSSIVFGNINGSTVYFLLVTEGDLSGSIFEFSLDCFELENISASFAEFIAILCGSSSVLAGYLAEEMAPYYGGGWLVQAYCSDLFQVKLSHA